MPCQTRFIFKFLLIYSAILVDKLLKSNSLAQEAKNYAENVERETATI